MMSQKFPFQNGTSHCDSIFTSWIQAKLDKNHFLCLKTPFLAQSYTPLCISIVFKQKQKFHRFNFSRRLISKTTAATPWRIDFAKILPVCLIDKNKKSPSLEVLDRAVLELWSIIWAKKPP